MVTIENYPYDVNDLEEVKLAWVAQENQRLLEESYTHEQIDALIEAPNWPSIDALEIIEGETLEERQAKYDRLTQENLLAYKATLHARLTAREEAIALQAHHNTVAAQEARIQAHFQADGGVPWANSIFTSSNKLKEMNDLLGTPDLTAKLDLLDAAKVAWDAEQAIKAQEEQILSVGKIVEARCTKALHYVAGMNVAASKTVEQIDAMEVEFAPILAALKNHRPDKASSLIALVVNPEYDVMKAKLLTILAGQ